MLNKKKKKYICMRDLKDLKNKNKQFFQNIFKTLYPNHLYRRIRGPCSQKKFTIIQRINIDFSFIWKILRPLYSKMKANLNMSIYYISLSGTLII